MSHRKPWDRKEQEVYSSNLGGLMNKGQITLRVLPADDMGPWQRRGARVHFYPRILALHF